MSFYRFKRQIVQTWSVLRIRANTLFDEVKQWLVVTWPEVKQALLEKVEELTAHLEERVKMSLPTKITMLGTTGAGKTCYMIGMFMYMQDMGTKGFTMSCQQNQALQIEEQWEKMTKGEEGNRWPDSTAATIEHSFKFNYGMKTFAQFDWLDYRGGALSDRAEAEDRQILVERLCVSDCVFFCLPADYLLLKSRQQANREAQVGKMRALMTDVEAEVNPTPENPFPVAIVITKADKLKDFDGSLTKKTIEAVKEIFKPLFVPESSWLVSIIGVSLGQELAEHPDSGEIEPIAVHLPVTFKEEEQLTSTNTIAQLQKRVEELEKQDSPKIE